MAADLLRARGRRRRGGARQPAVHSGWPRTRTRALSPRAPGAGETSSSWRSTPRSTMLPTASAGDGPGVDVQSLAPAVLRAGGQAGRAAGRRASKRSQALRSKSASRYPPIKFVNGGEASRSDAEPSPASRDAPRAVPPGSRGLRSSDSGCRSGSRARLAPGDRSIGGSRRRPRVRQPLPGRRRAVELASSSAGIEAPHLSVKRLIWP